jgi:hypothetical protein
MKIYQYWVKEAAKVSVDQEEVEIVCYGGSNDSEEAAWVKAQEKIDLIRRKIAGEEGLFEDYEIEIREQILDQLHEGAIVTRNRYGAQVLNVEKMMILDIDRAKWSWSLRQLLTFGQSNKERILARLRHLAKKPRYQECNFRIYETFQGIRVLVLGRHFDPRSQESQQMMRDFHCDPLYRRLCVKQGCFRARLSPKPGRIGVQKIRVLFPRTAEEEERFQGWLLDYETASKNFSVCRFVEQLGSAPLNDMVRFHDVACGVDWKQQKLA